MSFRVTNTGRVTGTAIPQLYLTLPPAAGEPSQRLTGFDRVTLRPGKSRTVRLLVDPASTDRPLSVWDTSTREWQIPAGRYQVLIGRSVDDIALSGGFTVH